MPDGFTLSPWSFGFNILCCGPENTNFHTDWEDPADAFITLHGTGKKIWIFPPPGKFAALYERLTENPKNLLPHLKDIKPDGSYCVQLPVDIVYLPFGQIHLVVEIATSFQCTCLLSVSNFITPERETQVWKLVSQGRLQRERVLRCWERPVSALQITTKI